MYWFVQWYKRKKNHYLFPLFTAIVGMVGGMLLTPTIGVIGIALSLYLALVIFLPWHNIHLRRKLNLVLPYIIPVVISIIIILPTWKYLITIFPSYTFDPNKQFIKTVTSTVEVYVNSRQEINTWMGDMGGYLAFMKEEDKLLVTYDIKSFIKQMGNNTVLYRGIFNMDTLSDVTQQKISFLQKAEYIKIRFEALPDKMQIKNGKAVVMINNEIRCEFIIPPQNMSSDFITIPDIREGLNCLKTN
ncbi:MAG: hypothetical protein JXA50_10680 [Deltaproteobacteria bacterium]|nr:hypothetical protein [Deltaproteobacteria bacterium]